MQLEPDLQLAAAVAVTPVDVAAEPGLPPLESLSKTNGSPSLMD